MRAKIPMRKLFFISTAVLALTMAPALAQPASREQESRSGPNGGYQRGPGQGGGNSMTRGNGPQQNSPQNVAPAQQPYVNAGGQRGGGPGGVQGNAGRSGHGGPFMGGSNTPFDIFGPGGRGFHDNTHYGHHDNNGYDALGGVLNARQRFHYGDYRRPQGWYDHRWVSGEILPALFFGQEYWIDNYAYFGLDYPPLGTVWIRDGNDALLIDRRTGEVIRVVYGIFY
jgi:Ni/Co efflux regulator RcnB